MVDIAFQRVRAVTFVTRRAKSVAVRNSCINPGSVLPLCTCEVSRRAQLLHQPRVGTTLVHLFDCLGEPAG